MSQIILTTNAASVPTVVGPAMGTLRLDVFVRRSYSEGDGKQYRRVMRKGAQLKPCSRRSDRAATGRKPVRGRDKWRRSG